MIRWYVLGMLLVMRYYIASFLMNFSWMCNMILLNFQNCIIGICFSPRLKNWINYCFFLAVSNSSQEMVNFLSESVQFLLVLFSTSKWRRLLSSATFYIFQITISIYKELQISMHIYSEMLPLRISVGSLLDFCSD